MSIAQGLMESIEKMRALGVEPASIRMTLSTAQALSREVHAAYPSKGGPPMFDGVRVEIVDERCGNCGGDGEWTINPQGGYGHPSLRACTACLRGPWSGMVDRLLDAYPEKRAARLRDALGLA